MILCPSLFNLSHVLAMCQWSVEQCDHVSDSSSCSSLGQSVIRCNFSAVEGRAANKDVGCRNARRGARDQSASGAPSLIRRHSLAHWLPAHRQISDSGFLMS